MKLKYILTCFLLLVSNKLIHAQNEPLIQTDTLINWQYHYYIGDSEFILIYQHYVGDSIINSISYNVFNRDLYKYDMLMDPIKPAKYTFKTFVRWDSGDLYVKDDYNDTLEHLVFSSNWVVGDTIKLYEKPGPDNLILTNIEKIVIANMERRVWHFFSEDGLLNPIFIEGIGSNIGDISAPLYFENEYGGYLLCCKINNEIVYGDGCKLTSINNPGNRLCNEVRIMSGNNREIIIDCNTIPRKNTIAEIYDITGRLIHQETLLSAKSIIHIPKPNITHNLITVVREGNMVIASEIILLK
jgi:hypothetical protein